MKNEYEWFESKRQDNIANRGLDIAFLGPQVIEHADALIIPDDRKDYGERRENAYAIIDGVRLKVCFTMRGENLARLITIHKLKEKTWRKICQS